MIKSHKMSLQSIYHTDFALTDIHAMRQTWSKGALFSMSDPRPINALILLDNCTGTYAGEDFTAFTAQKSVVCLPKGSRYTCHNLNCTNTKEDAILISFNIEKDGALLSLGNSPFLLHDVNFGVVRPLFNEVVDSFEDSAYSPVELKSAIWRLLAYLGKETKRTYQKKFQSIAKGIELLESNPLCEMSVAEIASVCNVSEGYFRRLFLEYRGETPTEFRLRLRLELAMRMLESDEATNDYIAEVAGFESATYFCRIFRRKIGMSPGEYRKSKRESGLS